MDINQTKEKIVGATVETVEKFKTVAKDTTTKVTNCAKECADKVHAKAHEVSGVVSRKGRSLTHKALNGICEMKWLAAAEHAIVGALNRVTTDPNGPVNEESTAAREETVI